MTTPAPDGYGVRPGRRLTVFLSSRDHVNHRLTVVELVKMARRSKMAGATVFRGQMGYGSSGAHHQAHATHDDAPETFVVVDRPELIEEFRRAVADLVGDALVVVDDVDIVEL